MTFRTQSCKQLAHRPGEEGATSLTPSLRGARGSQGAAFVCLPETYPSPWRCRQRSSDRRDVEAAARQRVQVGSERSSRSMCRRRPPKTHRHGLSAAAAGALRRTHTNGPGSYPAAPREFRTSPGRISGLRHWARRSARHVQRGHMPEVARALGAARAGGYSCHRQGQGTLWETWRTLIGARDREPRLVVTTRLFTLLIGDPMVAAEESCRDTVAVHHRVSIDSILPRSTRDVVGYVDNAPQAGPARAAMQSPELYDASIRGRCAKRE